MTRIATRRARPRAVAALSAVLAVLGLLMVPAGRVAAEPPSTVALGVAADGVFVGFGRGDIDQKAVVQVVEDIRFEGLRVVVVFPRDPQPTVAAFARRVQEATDADAALVFPSEGPLETYVIEDLSGARIRATEAARTHADPVRAVRVFADELTSEREVTRPEIIDRLIRIVLIAAGVIGVVVALEQIYGLIKGWLLRRWSKAAAARAEAKARAAEAAAAPPALEATSGPAPSEEPGDRIDLSDAEEPARSPATEVETTSGGG